MASSGHGGKPCKKKPARFSFPDFKAVVGVSEGNSWWQGWFKGVFRYGFCRLYLKYKRFSFIPRGYR